jgi:hypothetical protein
VTIDETVKALRIKDLDRTICGVATVYGQRRRDGRAGFSAQQFQDFLDLQIAIPLRVDHGPLVNSHGVIMNVGVARHFTEIKYPTDGLLCLAEVDHAEGYGDSLLADIAAITAQTWLPKCWGLSIAAHVTEDLVLPYEVSVTRSPAYAEALILGVGEDAIESWILLSDMADRNADRL